MANVIEIILKANDQATAQIRQVEGSLGKMQSLLAVIGGPAGLITAAAAGMTALAVGVKRFGDEMEALERSSKALGVNINEMRNLRQVEREVGVSQGELTFALQRMNRFIGQQSEALDTLGIKTRDVLEFTRQFGVMLRNTDDQGQKNAWTTLVMGRSSAELISVLEKFPELYDEISGGLVQLNDLQIEVGSSIDTMSDQIGRAFENMSTKVKQFAIDLFVASPLFLPFMSAFGGSTPPRGGAKLPPFKPPGGGKPAGGGGDEDRGALPWDRGLGAPGFHGVNGDIVMPEIEVVGKSLGYLRTLAEGVAYGIADAFSVAFSMIGQRGATLGRALTAAFQAMTQSILDALARIAASKFLLWIAGMFGTGGIGGALGAVFSKAGGIVGGLQTTGNTYVINAMDARDVVMQLQSPSGGMRRAADRVAIGAGY